MMLYWQGAAARRLSCACRDAVQPRSFFAGVGSMEGEHRYKATVDGACARIRLQQVNRISYWLAYLDIPHWETKSHVILTRYA
jgi:hypothetical protein